MDAEEFAEKHMGLELTVSQKALLQAGAGKNIYAIQCRLAKSRVEASAKATTEAVSRLKGVKGIGMPVRPPGRIKVLICGNPHLSGSAFHRLYLEASLKGIDVAVVDTLPESTTEEQGLEVLKMIRDEAAPISTDAFKSLTLEYREPYCDPHDHPVPKHPSKGHHSRTFGGVGRKHFQR